jgi:hypothetical protein
MTMKGGTMEPMNRTEVPFRGVRKKLDRWKSIGMAKASMVKSSLRRHPAKWAGITAGTGIALGAGIALGLTGRYLRRRALLRDLPDIVVIEATC